MKSALVIGLGQFGRHFAIRFAQLGNEVMVMDASEEKVTAIMPDVTSGQIGDCTNEDLLRSLGVRDFDVCVVAVGNDFEASLEIVFLLKELGASYVIVKAAHDRDGRLLKRCGADEIIYPEKEIGRKLAARISARNMFDYIELTPEYSIYEIPTPKAWVGKSIAALGVRSKYHVSILATKNGTDISPMPSPDYAFSGDEHLIILSTQKDLTRLPN